MEDAQFERAIARLPRWILLLGAVGTAVAMGFRGVNAAGGFLAGSIAAYLNFRIVERAANRVARMAGPEAQGPPDATPNAGGARPSSRVPAATTCAGSSKEGAKPGRGTGIWLLIRFGLLVAGAVVIIEYSGFNLAAAFCGFLVCPAAVVLEIVYELIAYDHS